MNVDFPRRVSLGFEDFLLTTQFAEKVRQGAEVRDASKNLCTTNFKTTAGCLALYAACGNGLWATPAWSKVVGSGGFNNDSFPFILAARTAADLRVWYIFSSHFIIFVRPMELPQNQLLRKPQCGPVGTDLVVEMYHETLILTLRMRQAANTQSGKGTRNV